VPVIDPSGFQISVVLVTADGRFPLWLRGATIGEGEDAISIFRGAEINLNDLPIVQGVDMDINLGLNGKVNVEIGAPFELGQALLQSQLFTIGNAIEVQIGYPKLSMFTPWFSTMAAKPSFSISPDEGLSATLNGEGGAFSSIRAGATTVYRNTNYARIIREIATGPTNGWWLRIPQQGDPGSDQLYADRSVVSQGNLSDWSFIQILSRAADCDAYMAPPDSEGSPSVLYVVAREEYATRRPRYTFLLRGNPDFVNYFPIFEFESSAEDVWLPRGSGPVRWADVNPDDRSEPEGTEDGEDQTRVGGDAGPAGGSVEADDQTVSLIGQRGVPGFAGRFLSTSARDPRGQEAVARQERREQGMAGGLNATITTIGIPDIFPGDIIRLETAGIFDGNYAVQGLSHKAGEGEWTTSMRLLNNAMQLEAIHRSLSRFFERANREEPERREEAGSGIGTETVVPSPFED